MGKKRKQTDEETTVEPETSHNDDSLKKKKTKKHIATCEEMAEASKIKMSLDHNLESKKSKKRKKHLANVKNKKSRTDQKYQEEIVTYLKSYSEDKANWKFQKMKQIYIQQNVFDVNKIDDDLWYLALEYLGNSKGKSKDELCKKAQEIIEKIDAESERKDQPELLEQPLYLRARELLQMIQ